MFKAKEEARVKNGQMGTTAEAGNNGLFLLKYKGQHIWCIISDNDEWEHVSVTVNYPGRPVKRPPTWEIMSVVKSVFWEEEAAVFQFHPPKSEYVNYHPFCLHLWRPANGEIRRPPKKLVNNNIE